MRRVFRFGELFSGPGGLSLGIDLGAADVGLEVNHIWAYDSDACAVDTYNQWFGADVAKVADIRQLPDIAFRGVDGMAFGFPCNDFSIVGERRGLNGRFGPLYKECVRAVERHRPEWFIAENVGGLKSGKAGGALTSILQEFEELGYVLTPHLYKFEEYGVPQRRHRIIIIGVRADQSFIFRVPAPNGSTRTARQAIEDPPIPPGAENHEFTRQAPQVIERLRALEPGANAFSDSLPQHLRLNVRGARISQIYRRLHPDRPAYTVTGSGGGGTHVYHWSEPRALTNRERARLQTFPDNFAFSGGKEAVRRQIGMAVPPEGARVIARALFQAKVGVPYAHVPSNLEHLVPGRVPLLV